MPDSDNKKKMISLRLSETEFEALKTQYRTYGARNVSDLARLALRQIMKGSEFLQDNLSTRVEELSVRVSALESKSP